MNKILFIGVFIFLYSSCVYKTEKTTSSTRTTSTVVIKEPKKGFSFDKKYIKLNNSFYIKDNLVYANQFIFFKFEGVKNATKKENYQHIGMELTVKDDKGEIIKHVDDLFEDDEKQDPSHSLYFATYYVPHNLKEGSKIKIETRLFDNLGKESDSYHYSYSYIVTNKIPPKTKGVEITTNSEKNISSQIFHNEKYQFKKTPTKFYSNEKLTLIINGLDDFADENNNMLLKYNVSINDSKGNNIHNESKEFKEKASMEHFIYLTYTKTLKGLKPGDYTLTFSIQDLKSDKYLDLKFDFIISK